MKLIAYLFGSLTLILALIFGLLFSSVGNSILSSQIQSALDEQKLGVTIEKFSLDFSNFDFLASLGEGARVKIDGKLSLFKQQIDSKFDIDIKELDMIKFLNEYHLRGALKVVGDIKGSKDLLSIDAQTMSLGGSTEVEAQLLDMQPESLNLQTSAIELKKILYILGKNAYADALIDINVDAKHITHGVNSVADATLKVSNGEVNAKIVNEDFGLKFDKKVAFNANAKYTLKDGILNSVQDIGGDIANIYSKAELGLTDKMPVDAEYSISIANLNSLYFVTSTILNGSVVVEGTAKGDKEQLVVNGKSDIFDSQNTYYVTLKDYQADSLEFNFIGMKIEQMLYMLNMPIYSKGLINLDGTVNSLSQADRSGTVNAKIYKASVDRKVLQDEMNLTMRSNLGYEAITKTKISGSDIESSVDFESDVASLNVKNARYNLDTKHLKSDYLVDIEDLSKLYFVAKRDLKGAIKIKGDIEMKDSLSLTAHSDTLGGVFDATLKENILDAKAKGIEVLQLTNMLTYPEVFDSKGDLNATFDLANSTLKADVVMNNGRFVPNQLTSILKQTANIDLENEVYKNATIHADMENSIVNANLNMKSENSTVSVDEFILNTITEKINAQTVVEYKKRKIYAKVGGTMSKPKVSVDMNKLMKDKGEKELNKLIDKKVPEEFKKPLKNLFKLF